MLRGRGGPDAGRGAGGGDAAPATVYKMQEKLVSIGDDFWIEKGNQRAFKVDGKAVRVRDTLKIEDVRGNEVASIQERMVNVRDTMEIERGGRPVAKVKKAMLTPMRERFTIDLTAGGQMEAQGNITDHNYTITQAGQQVAEISKRWFRVRDTYGIEVAPGQDDGLILAVAVVIDQMTSDIG
jgi:uncharacterized protein YxjI